MDDNKAELCPPKEGIDLAAPDRLASGLNHGSAFKYLVARRRHFRLQCAEAEDWK